VRHEHEYHLWDTVKLPEGKILVPGVVSHATNVLEHPELVAERISRFVSRIGNENVMAGTDCGLGGRVHPQLALAKLKVLAEGAALASASAGFTSGEDARELEHERVASSAFTEITLGSEWGRSPMCGAAT
jgi:hypothetical protein